MEEDVARGGERIYMASDYLTQFLAFKAQNNMLSDNDRGWFELFLNAAHQGVMSPQVNARLIMLNIFLLNNLFFELDGTLAAANSNNYKSHYREAILRLSELAPEREDFAAPFLNQLARFSDGTADFETGMLKKILAVEPDHSSALWLLGKQLSKSKDAAEQKQGHDMQQRAVALGVDRVYPVTEAELKPFR